MEIYNSAKDLPEEWDKVCRGNYALKRSNLSYMEQTNPCSQKYYLFRDDANNIDSVFMTFKKKKHNIAMFSPINVYLDVTFIYVPLSVANAGIIIGEKTKDLVYEAIKNIKGCKLILNLKTNPNFKNFTFGLTCSNILMDLKWDSFAGYLANLRSNYRYRYKKAIKAANGLTFNLLEDNNHFDDSLYKLYEQVFNNSKFQVEKLSKSFFQGNIGKIIVAYKEELPVGFIQLIENKTDLIFGFIGIDYKYNERYDLYINMLLKIVEYGIQNGFKRIDLGQTADEAKLKLGGKYESLYALVHHSNPLIHYFIKLSARLIEYKPIKIKYNVFK